MILAFKEQFKRKILEGTKIHTIRDDPKDRWKSWREIDFATGVRTKEYNCFKKCQVMSTQHIFMTYAFDDIIEITIGSRYIADYSEKEQLAINDGFDSYKDFFDWFYPLIDKHPKKQFTGKIIHWTDKRY